MVKVMQKDGQKSVGVSNWYWWLVAAWLCSKFVASQIADVYQEYFLNILRPSSRCLFETYSCF